MQLRRVRGGQGVLDTAEGHTDGNHCPCHLRHYLRSSLTLVEQHGAGGWCPAGAKGTPRLEENTMTQRLCRFRAERSAIEPDVMYLEAQLEGTDARVILPLTSDDAAALIMSIVHEGRR